MVVIKCKMCGGNLTVKPGITIAECEYCGITQTIPNADNEKMLTLFSRANRFRAENDFDKASVIYESIIAEFPHEAEAYWGLVLCKYGIEYVDDPATAKKIPTCHRSSFESVTDDKNYEAAVMYADVIAKRIYIEEAKQLEDIRKGIIDTSSKEEAYDIFICYKETDESGERTAESVFAQIIYDMLTEKGYRVFFARITLEDKFGQEYEPCIFAALNSSKIMLAIGTSYDHYSSVWVKNEWSRYLRLMAKDKEKHIIPCYRDMDAYDIPKELQQFQSLDYGKIGAEQDLLRAIQKYIPLKKSAPTTGQLQQQAKQLIESGKTLDAISFIQQSFNCSFAEAKNTVEALQIESAPRRSSYSPTSPAPQKSVCPTVTSHNTPDLEHVRNLIAPLQRFFVNKEGWKEIHNILTDNGTVLSHNCTFQGRRNIFISGRGANITSIDGGRIVTNTDQVIKHKKSFIGELTLLSDGSMRAQGWNSPAFERKICESSDISDFIDGNNHIILLKKNGALIYVEKPSCSKYTVIKPDNERYVSVTDGMGAWGLRSNGTVKYLSIADSILSIPEYAKKIQLWNNIVAISASSSQVVGLKADGTVVAQSLWCGETFDVSYWRGIVAVCAGSSYTLGLNVHGEVLVTNTFGYDTQYNGAFDYNTPVLTLRGYEKNYKIPNLVVFSNSKADEFRQVYSEIPSATPYNYNFNYNYLTAQPGTSFDITPQALLTDIMNQESALRAARIKQGVCQHCGGTFKGMFSKKCTKCGKDKEY